MTTNKEKKEFTQDEKTKKFVEQAQTLIKDGKVKSYSDIARDIDWPKTAVSDAINGRRNIPFDVLKKFTDYYNLGEKDWRDEKIELLQQMNDLLKIQLENKKALLGELHDIKNDLDSFKRELDSFRKSHDLTRKELNELKHSQLVGAALQLSFQEHWLSHFYDDKDKIESLRQSIGQKAFDSLLKMKKLGIESGSGMPNNPK